MAQVVELGGGRRATYESLGEGEPLLWLQGGPGLPAALARPDAALLADRFAVYLIDPHGSGGSTPPADEDDYDPQGHAHFYDEVRRALGLGPVSLLGFSFGGGVALAYAALFPEAVRRCAVVGAFAMGVEHDPQRTEAQLERALAPHRAAPWFAAAEDTWEHWTERVLAAGDAAEVDAMMRTVLPLYFAHPDRPAVAAYIEVARREMTFDLRAVRAWEGGLFQRIDLRPLLAGIRCPLLVMAGDLDPVGGPPQAEAIAGAVPQARLVVVPDCGHFVPADAPDAFRRTVLGWAETDDN